MILLNCGRTKAWKVMNEIREKYNGAIIGRPNVIKASSFWEREGTTIERELSVIEKARAYANVL